jgi:hypothetical protein
MNSDSALPILASSENCVHHFFMYWLVSPQHKATQILGFPHSRVAPITRIEDKRCLSTGWNPSTSRTLKRHDWFSYTVCHTELSENLIAEEISQVLDDGLRVWYPTHPLHSTYTGPSTANTFVRLEFVTFSHIMMDHFKYISVMLSPVQISIR